MEVLNAADADRIGKLLDQDHFFWLDLVDEDFPPVAEQLGLHPAAIEDTREWGQLPKLDDYGDHVLLVFFSAHVTDDGAEPVEVHVYVSGSWIVTVRRCETPLDSLDDRLRASDFEEEDEIVYLVLDALMDGWDPVIVQLDDWVDEVESAVFTRVRQGQLKTAYYLKQQVNDLVRHITPQRARYPHSVEAINRLPGITRGSREWLRDVQAHLDMVASDLGRVQNDLSDLTQTFYNANANRLNRTATRLTVVGVFFLIWTLVTGFFGQNFQYLTDHISSERAFWAYEVGALVIPSVILGTVLWIRRRDWW